MEKNLIKDFFEELAGGRPRGDLEGRAIRLGCDLTRPHVVLVAEPASDALERALRLAAPGSLFDRREHSVRALVNLSTTSFESFLERLQRIHDDFAEPASVGVSSVCEGEAAFADGFAEASRRCSGRSCCERNPQFSRTRTSARTSTCCGSRSTAASAMPRSTPSRASRSTTRNAGPSSSSRSRSSCVATATSARPRRRSSCTEHLAPAAQENRRALRTRPAEGRLADDRDRGEDGEARAGTRYEGKTQHIAAAQVWRYRTFIAGNEGVTPISPRPRRAAAWVERQYPRTRSGRTCRRADRVRVRAVRRHVRAAEREARPRRLAGGLRRPAVGWRRLRGLRRRGDRPGAE